MKEQTDMESHGNEYDETPEQKIAQVSESFDMKQVCDMLEQNLPEDDPRPTVHLAVGDPSSGRCFRTSPVAEDALIQALRSANFNGYAPSYGLLSARRAIAEYLSRDLPYGLSPDDVYLTCGCKAALETILSVLNRPHANILLPRPGFPCYEAHADFCKLEVRHFDLLPEKGWEVDLDAVEALADENTVGLVIINPGNPCSSVFSYQHLENIVETAQKLKITIIADEVYGNLVYGENPFIPMGVFGSIVPVITLGSMSKTWMVPGWRFGWIVTTDPTGFFRKSGVVDSIKKHLSQSPYPATFIQGAVSDIIEKTPVDFFSRTVEAMKHASEICYTRIKEIPCLSCPPKPQGGMFLMVKLNVPQLEDVSDDMEFCLKLVKEESVFILPGVTVGLKNWLRISFGTELSFLEDGLDRIKAFCARHAKMQ